MPVSLIELVVFLNVDEYMGRGEGTVHVREFNNAEHTLEAAAGPFYHN